MTIRDVWRLLYGEDVTGGTKVTAEQYRLRCPFHADQHPSCDVSLAKDTWFCRSCGIGGGKLDLVQRELGVSHDRAGAWLRANE